ncbi:hypothetical protein PHMEG_0001903 [Phytophthora megakarya]|uniref:HIT-type domain-containing protein n=1 Tax=Phytophthora megakarya TaxID=4795 RepID=A0A225X218_9STRA|nr:hypothetical protein PHMEG_0001903 [Phytophthora megakarya]
MVDAGSKRELDTETEMALCSGCGKSDVKYRCPRCERITCSLQCCVAHKKQVRQFDCNGKRDRTKFVQLKQFTDADLSSDFFFLEEVSRSTNSANRSRTQLNANARRYTSNKKRKVATNQNVSAPINPDIPADWLARFPIAVQLFAEHSAKRGVALTLLAPGMSKRARNSSYMDTKKNTMYWRIEWTFPNAEVPVNQAEERANEKSTLFELLGKYLTPNQENVAIRGKLRKYAVSDWQNRILLLLRKEFTPASQPQYYRLDGSQSLESNLKRKAVVEFPVVTVVLTTDADKYPVAYDVIETITPVTTEAENLQLPTEEPESMEVEEEEPKKQEKEMSINKVTPELLTGEATNPTEKLFSISEEEHEEILPPVQPKNVLIEEIPVAAH